MFLHSLGWLGHIYANWQSQGVSQHGCVTSLTNGETTCLVAFIHPEFAISNTIQLLKANSSKWINDQRKLRGRFEWQRGYGAFSVSQSMSDALKRYISKQWKHHSKQNFVDEYLSMLSNHQVEFDPKYVFEQEIVA